MRATIDHVINANQYLNRSLYINLLMFLKIPKFRWSKDNIPHHGDESDLLDFLVQEICNIFMILTIIILHNKNVSK